MNVRLGNPVELNGGITEVQATVNGTVHSIRRIFQPFEECHREHIVRGMYLEIMSDIYDKHIKGT